VTLIEHERLPLSANLVAKRAKFVKRSVPYLKIGLQSGSSLTEIGR